MLKEIITLIAFSAGILVGQNAQAGTYSAYQLGWVEGYNVMNCCLDMSPALQGWGASVHDGDFRTSAAAMGWTEAQISAVESQYWAGLSAGMAAGTAASDAAE